MTQRFYLMAVDMSLRAAGFVAVHRRFAEDIDWSKMPSVVEHRVLTETWGLSLQTKATIFEQLARLRELRDRALRFWHEAGCPSHVFFEEYAFSQSDSYAHAIGEAGGVAKLALADAGATVSAVHSQSARKLLCGHVPRKSKDAKALVRHVLEDGFGFADLHEAEYDALAVANYGLSELGQPCLAMPQVDPKKGKRK